MKIKLTGVDYIKSRKSGEEFLRICGIDSEGPKNGGCGLLTQNLIGSKDIPITSDMLNKWFVVCTNGKFVTDLYEVK